MNGNAMRIVTINNKLLPTVINMKYSSKRIAKQKLYYIITHQYKLQY